MHSPLPKPIRVPKARKPIPRTSRPRPQRKSDSAAMVRKADKRLRIIVSARSVFCERDCGNLATEVHHMRGRRYHSTRWLPHACAHLCARCHEIVQHSPVLNESLGRRLVGDEGWEALVRLSRVRDGRGAAAHVEMLKRYAGLAGIDTQEAR
jgi:hypothetical protein